MCDSYITWRKYILQSGIDKEDQIEILHCHSDLHSHPVGIDEE